MIARRSRACSARPATAHEERYRPRRVTRVGAGFLHLPGRGLTEDLSFEPDLAAMLRRWSRFESLDGVASAAVGMGPLAAPDTTALLSHHPGVAGLLGRCASRTRSWLYDRRAAAARAGAWYARTRGRLGDLAAAGTLISEQQLLREAAAIDAMHDEARITTIGCVTRDRPHLLARWVSWWAGAVENAAGALSMLVVDESSDPAMRHRNRSVLLDAVRCLRVPIRYLDADERSRWASWLTGRGVPSSVSSWVEASNSPDRRASGMIVLQLATAGELALLGSDEDLIAVGPEAPRGGLTVTEEEPLDGVERSGSGLASGAALEWLQAHERFLGRALPAVIRTSVGDSVDLDVLCGHLVDGLTDAEARVAVTSAGTQAPLGRVTLARLVLSAHPNQQRFGLSAIANGLARQRPTVAYRASRAALSHLPAVNGRCVGFDNRVLLPPHLQPATSGGAIFEVLFEQLTDKAFCGHVPATTMGPAAIDEADMSFDGQAVGLAAIVRAALACVPPVAGSRNPDLRFRIAGRRLVELARVSTDDLERHLRPHVWEAIKTQLSPLVSAVDRLDPRGCEWARASVVSVQDRMRRLAAQPVLAARELLGDGTPGDSRDARDRTRAFIGRLGELLEWWPEVTRLAGELKTTGWLARPGAGTDGRVVGDAPSHPKVEREGGAW